MKTRKLALMVIVLITLLASNVWAEKYAVLITGDYAAEGIKSEEMWNAGEGKDPEYGFDEFWNDTYLMWEMLREKGYSDENIFVLFAGGEDFQPDWMDVRYLVPLNLAPMTDYAATKSNVEMVFEGLADGTGGFPQLQGDDFLFVWTFDHGGGGQDAYLCLMYGQYIWDYEFADLTDQINCHKKVFWMQQCHSGGFIDNLQGEDTFIITACHWSTGADRADDNTVSGGPAIENEIINGRDYHHGEFNFHIYSSTNGCSPAYYTHYPEYTGELYTDADTNEDEIISVMEGADWEMTHESEWATPQYADDGDIGETTSLEYPTLLIEDITSSMEITGLTAISGITIHIENGATLTIPENAELCLVNGAELIVNDGSVHIAGGELLLDDNSNLIVYDNVTLSNRSLVEVTNGSKFKLRPGSSLYGTEGTTWVDTDTGERYDTWVEMHNAVPNHNGNMVVVPGDRIIVNDGMFNASGTSDNRITITSVGDGRWDGIEINNSNSYPGNMGIGCCDVSKIGHIKLNNSHFGLSYSTYSHCGQISAVNNSYLSTWYSTIDNILSCPIYCVESKVAILNSTIRDNMGTGVLVYLPSDTLSCVSANLITLNRWGIHVIDAPMYCINNSIINNTSHGFVSYGAGGISILAGNTIRDNAGLELAGLYQWPDITSRIQTWGPNIINSHDYGGTDHYLLGGPPEGNDCRGNDIDISDTTRFLPSFSAYIFDGEKPPEKVIYEEGIAEILDGEYESAKVIMKEIVSDYPETKTAVSALQWLMYLEKFEGKDYSGLRSYIETIDEISYPNLEKVKYNTTTSSYMAEADYITSIDRLEAILADPQSVADSILALIDEGYCYLKLDEQGDKAASVECRFKPRCFEEFKYVSQNMTRNLLDKAIPHPEPSTPIVESFALYQNYPNPMRPDKIGTTTISFSIPKDAKNSEIKIYNIKGQLVKQFSISNEKSSIEWNGKDESGRQVVSGIYLYKLDTGEKSITKKIVLLR